MSVELREYKDAGETFQDWGLSDGKFFYPFCDPQTGEVSKPHALKIQENIDKGFNDYSDFEGIKLNKTRRIDVESEHSYDFVSREEDVDYVRIVKEAPKGTPYIVVEEKTRTGKGVAAVLLVHNSILSNKTLEGKYLAGEPISSTWGLTNVPVPGDTEEETELYSYRYRVVGSKFPGIIKQDIEKLRRALNPKSAKTTVSYI